MTASTLKALVVIAAVVVGGIVLAKGFSGSPGPSTVAISPVATITPTQGATPKPGKSPKPVKVKPSPSESPAVGGERLGIYNATSQSSLAKTASTAFQSEGYVIKQVGNATDTSTTSAVYYVKQKDAEAAQAFADKNFKKVTAAALPSGFQIVDSTGTTAPPEKGVQIVAILGADYQPK